MPFGYRDRVWEVTTSQGTGDLDLGGVPASALASTGHQTFLQGFGGDYDTDVAIFGQGFFEGRRVHFNSVTNRIERSGTLWSSSTGTTIDFPPGEKHIICAPPAALIMKAFFPVLDAGAPPHVLSAVQAFLANQTI